MTRIPNLSLRSSLTSTGVAPSGTLANSLHHPFMPTALRAASGFLLILNGVDMNRRLAEFYGSGSSEATATFPLQMRPPREPITPFFSQYGTGRVFRQGAKWRYRWKNSSTGEVSGLSPIPAYSWNVGVETPAGGTTYLGQTAHFYISTSAAPPGADTIELFANTAQETTEWWLAASKAFSGSTTVLLKDDNTDDELRTNLSVNLLQPSGPTWAEGVMPPMCDALIHTTARTFYWGLRRCGRWMSYYTVTVTQGSDLVTLHNTTAAGTKRGMLDPGRVGQRVNFTTSPTPVTLWTDNTVYRVAEWVSATQFRVYPEIQISTSLAEGATSTSFYCHIEDDRDGRAIWMSEPGQPWLIDPLKTIYAGESYDEDVLRVFPLGTSYFAQTQRRIYALQDDNTADPSLSIAVIPGPSEGAVGRHAGCVTPFGWVFLNQHKGVRVFDGQSVFPLGGDADPYSKFLPETQLARMEPSCLEIARVFYEKKTNTVWVAYVPLEGSTLSEAISFHASERVWRGPHRVRMFSVGEIETATDEATTVFGDDCGNLFVTEREDGVKLDAVPTSVTGAALTGTVTSIVNARTFGDSGNGFDGDSDQRLRGSPIWFADPSGNLYFGRIMDVPSATTLELDGPVVDETGATAVVAVGWTYAIGTIRWTLVTSYIDEGDPVHPKHFDRLDTRFKRGSNSETFTAEWSKNGSSTFHGESTDLATSAETIASRDTNAVNWGEMRLGGRGASAQLRLRGSSRYGDPQITIALLNTAFEDGTLGTTE